MSAQDAGRAKPVIWAVIPARYGSTRFPGKPLALLAGKPMIQHVFESARQAVSFSRVMVATDDVRIEEAVRGFGGTSVMTGEVETGTDRIAAAVEKEMPLHGRPDWVMNIQGDEPLIHSGDLDTLARGLPAAPDGVLGTLVFPLQSEEELHDPNVVKAVLDKEQRAIYFSRAPIPYPRGEGGLGWRHLGIYLFRTDFLFTFSRLPQTPLARREQLEQLRALENGYPIHCFEAAHVSVGVDVPADLERVATHLQAS